MQNAATDRLAKAKLCELTRVERKAVMRVEKNYAKLKQKLLCKAKLNFLKVHCGAM